MVGDVVMRVDGGVVVLARWQYLFREHKNLVQHNIQVIIYPLFVVTQQLYNYVM